MRMTLLLILTVMMAGFTKAQATDVEKSAIARPLLVANGVQQRIVQLEAEKAEPTADEFKAFCQRFMEEWEKNATAQLKGVKFTFEILSIDKKKTDSLLHPIVWVLVAREVMGGDTSYRNTFNFYWDGKRWVGLESEMNKYYPAPETKNKIDEKRVDVAAVAAQRKPEKPEQRTRFISPS